jgi:hypothetical protein
MAHPADGADDAAPARRRFFSHVPAVGGLEVLSRRVARAVDDHVSPDEHIVACLRGDLNHSLVSLGERLLIVKPGYHAGTTFGTIVTTIYYEDVTGIQVHTFLRSAWIEISSPSFQGRERKRNRHPRPSDRDVYKLPNCVPIAKRRLGECGPFLADLRGKVRSAKLEQPAAGAGTIATELEGLARLREGGAITDEEFERAKALLLGTQHPNAA